MMKKEKINSGFLKSLKKDFVYGLLVLIPIIITFWFVSFCIDLISIPAVRLFGTNLSKSYGVVLSIIIIFLIGFMTRYYIGSFIINLIDEIIFKIPFVSKIYRSIKHIIGSFSNGNKNFMRAVLVEYPRKGLWSIGFVTRENVNGLIDVEGVDMGQDKLSVFLPSTPNPTSGFFVFVDKGAVKPLQLSVEDSIKILMSAGVVDPFEK